MTFYDGTTILGIAPVVNGRAAISAIPPAPGIRTLTARFAGGSVYGSGISSAFTQTVSVNPATTLRTPASYPTSSTINQQVAVADFNGDGHLDIVTNNYTVMMGNGDGTFQTSANYTSSSNAYAVATGDFNGDGKPDFATARYDGAVGVWLNKGDGTFQAPVLYQIGAAPRDIVVADFNNDGIPDIAVASRQGQGIGVGVLLGVGDGTFQPVVTYLAGRRQTALAVADFNGDGNADIVAVDGDDLLQEVTVLLGAGDGTFHTTAFYDAAFAQFVATGDFNNDGRPDFVVLDESNQLHVFLGNGDATFAEQPPGALTQNWSGGLFFSLAIGDFDGDGNQDVAWTGSGAPTISVFLGNGDGTFRGAVNFPAGPGEAGSVVAAEFNGDGRTDLAVTNSSTVQILLGGTGDFPVVTTLSVPDFMSGTPYSATLTASGGTTPYTWSVSAGSLPVPLSASGTISGTPAVQRFTGTGAVTVVVSGPNGPGFRSSQTLSVQVVAAFQISAFVITGEVGVPYQFSSLTATGGTPPYQNWQVTSGSLPPGITLDHSSGQLGGTPTTPGNFLLTVTVNDSAGLTSLPAELQILVVPAVAVTTQSVPNATTGVPYYTVLTATGGLEIAKLWAVSSGALAPGLTLDPNAGVISGTPNSAAGSPYRFSITASDGASVSPPQPLTIVVSNPVAITMTLTSSANPSLFGKAITLTASVSLATATGKVTFYDGVNVLGTGMIHSGQAVFTTRLLSPGTHAFEARYFAPPVSATLSQVVTATAGGVFQAPITYASGNGNTAYLIPVVVADFNGDGQPDVATFASVLLGKGDGTFQAPLVHAVGINPLSLVVGDFDENGIPDLAVSDFSGLEVFAGKGDGTFGKPTAYPGIGLAGFIAAADFNGDGHTDLLVTGNDGTAQLFLGIGDGTFRPALSVPIGTASAGAITVSDFNGDGNPDFAVADALSGKVNVMLGNGDGTFQAPVTYLVTVGSPNSGISRAIVAGDLNGDGKGDLAVYGPAIDTLSVLLGRGDGTFAAAKDYATGGSGYGNTLAITDFNGDGIADLAASGGLTSAVAVLLGNGDGSFQTVSYPVGNTGTPSQVAVSTFALGDFNGDGRPDFAVGNMDGTWNVLLAATSGTLNHLTLSPVSLNLNTAIGGKAASQTVAFSCQSSSPSSPTFTGNVSTIQGSGWLSASPASGPMILSSHAGSVYTYTATINISADPSGIGTATILDGFVNFTACGGEASLPVTMAVATAKLTLSPATLTISAAAGGAAVTQTVTINYQTSGSPASAFTSSVITLQGNGWITVSPGSGNMTQRPFTGFYNYSAQVTIRMDPSKLAGGTQYQGAASFVVNGVTAVLPITMTLSGGSQPTAIVNAASPSEPSVVALGGYVRIHGVGLAQSGNPSATLLPLPTKLNGTQVSLGGLSMPLIYAASDQVIGLVPQSLAPNSSYPLVVTSGANAFSPVMVTVTEFQPGIYTVDSSGSGAAVVTNAETGRPIGISNPAHPFDQLIVYGTGLGLVQGPNGQAAPTDGTAAPANVNFQTTARVSATIGGLPATVLFSGLTPGFAGLDQVKIQLPAGVSRGNAVPLQVMTTDPQTGATAQSNVVTIAVQ